MMNMLKEKSQKTRQEAKSLRTQEESQTLLGQDPMYQMIQKVMGVDPSESQYVEMNELLSGIEMGEEQMEIVRSLYDTN